MNHQCEAIDETQTTRDSKPGGRCKAQGVFAPDLAGKRRNVCWLHYQALNNPERARPLKLVIP